jgi:hypothetical protein
MERKVTFSLCWGCFLPSCFGSPLAPGDQTRQNLLPSFVLHVPFSQFYMADTDWDLISSYAGLLCLASLSIYCGAFGSLSVRSRPFTLHHLVRALVDQATRSNGPKSEPAPE